MASRNSNSNNTPITLSQSFHSAYPLMPVFQDRMSICQQHDNETSSSSTSSSRRLHVLPCLHAFCRQCLEGQRSPGDPLKLKCPTCDQKVSISESGVEALPSSNFFLNNLLDVVVSSEEQNKNGCRSNKHSHGLLGTHHLGEAQCSSCDEGNPATSHCLDCQEYLCDNCVLAHQRVRLTKDHFIERFIDSLQMASRNSNSNNTPITLSQSFHSAYPLMPVFQDRMSICQQHDNEVFRFFCDTCSVPICRECSVGRHVGHSFIYLHDAVQDSKAITIQLLADAQQGRQAVQVPSNSYIDAHIPTFYSCTQYFPTPMP
ncbi:UNVERIFIED_CONTAM: hypothetical protein FKN15_051230 [Acipenser sinensis]